MPIIDTSNLAHYEFKRGASIHEHQVIRPGLVAVVPPDARHSVKALTDGRAIIVDYPVRRGFE